jgi:hypothetical protein
MIAFVILVIWLELALLGGLALGRMIAAADAGEAMLQPQPGDHA